MSETPGKQAADLAHEIRAAIAVQEARSLDLEYAKRQYDEAKARTSSLLEKLKELDDSF